MEITSEPDRLEKAEEGGGECDERGRARRGSRERDDTRLTDFPMPFVLVFFSRPSRSDSLPHARAPHPRPTAAAARAHTLPKEGQKGRRSTRDVSIDGGQLWLWQRPNNCRPFPPSARKIP